MTIPTSISFAVSQENSKPFRIHLPSWILLPLVILVIALILPFVFLVDILALLTLRVFPLTRVLVVLIAMGFSLKGLEIDVSSKSEKIFIAVN